ncbi:MAG: tRNA preQ1(34) S-adenosylmethionine ribosyltransferase-isomerase QueA [Candidatus Fimivivens sp.]
MLKSDFYFALPKELIAQTPIEPRNASRLLTLDRTSGVVEHRMFTDLYTLLKPGDLLVLNDSRVLPARILGVSETGDNPMEFLLLEQQRQDEWEVLVRPGKRAKPGARFIFGEGLLRAEVLEILEGGNRLVRFSYDSGSFYSNLEQIGQMPLPPYITEKLDDPERYQTVYSKELGSAAAPTAGLHFTEQMLDNLRAKGIKTAFVTLHVGLGTFRPVKEDDINDHKMHSEHIFLPQQTADLVNETKQNGGRVIAVGTTSCRTLEAVGQMGMPIKAYEGYTEIFLYPGKKFTVIDGLITNFHLPESTLIMLVSAFAGREHVLAAYNEAVAQKYRFFSFGDACFIANID